MRKNLNLPLLRPALLAVLLITGACKQAYVPAVLSSNVAQLVVEGFINNGSDSTLFYLTRSFTLDDSAQLQPELHAKVDVEGQDNSVYPLIELGNGHYGVATLSLNGSVNYRLHIRTSNAREYVSDYLGLKTSPPIDSISYQRGDSGLQISVSTHDPQNASRYYRWEYQQTWEFQSPYFSVDQYVNHKIIQRPVDSIYTCWQGANSTSIILASTARLSQDVVDRSPLVLIPNGSPELRIEYSILVKQFTLTAGEYNFWTELQKNSEQIGSIFSPEPSQSKGNMHSVSDSNDVVIGYIGAGTMRQQRIFITELNIGFWPAGTDENACRVSSIPTPDSSEFYLGAHEFLPLQPTAGVDPGTREDISTEECVDCTLRGTNSKPSFWQ